MLFASASEPLHKTSTSLIFIIYYTFKNQQTPPMLTPGYEVYNNPQYKRNPENQIFIKII